jgi:predicted mannosyl-3-phosphoglycerate phosphatase (HAD superfamily)
MKNSKIIYLSGAITADKKYKDKFNSVAIKLKERGYKVINPAEEVKYEIKKSWISYVIECLELIKKENPDTIYLMKTWKRSVGAQIERLVFLQLEKKIIDEREDV